jgi:hypothetical protein
VFGSLEVEFRLPAVFSAFGHPPSHPFSPAHVTLRFKSLVVPLMLLKENPALLLWFSAHCRVWKASSREQLVCLCSLVSLSSTAETTEEAENKQQMIRLYTIVQAVLFVL